MTTEKAGGYISQLLFNDGSTLDIKQNDIVIFVGPNNAGKSQSLKDIYALSAQRASTTVISDISIIKRNIPLASLLERISIAHPQGAHTNYSVLGQTINYREGTSDNSFLRNPYYGDYRNLFVKNLDTAARLTICTPPGSISRNTASGHPIHFAASDANYRKWLSSNFKKAFGEEIIPNTQYGSIVPLCIGAPVKLNDTYDDEQLRLEAYAEILSTYKQVHNQGDGIKSFTGILLYLMLDYYCTYIIDEPESFLHPPQARIMGQIIGQTLSDQQQAFISTHSEEIIKGLMEACPDRIKIIRITRTGDTNSFAILDNERFSDIWSDPLLKYSNIMSSLFHKTVVLCESDADCKMYSIIESHIKQTEGKYSETLFIHCGGKHRMAKIAAALHSLNVDIKLIPDIDVLNDAAVFRKIIEAFGIDWSEISRDYNIVVSNLHSPKEKINRIVARSAINAIIDSSTNENLSDHELRDIHNAISTISKWKAVKMSGLSAFPPGDATTSFLKLNRILQSAGIHIVPVGELECFVKTVGKHGPEWVNLVLETYPDLNNEIYTPITQFVREIHL